jgi:hypothetical protein
MRFYAPGVPLRFLQHNPLAAIIARLLHRPAEEAIEVDKHSLVDVSSQQ